MRHFHYFDNKEIFRSVCFVSRVQRQIISVKLQISSSVNLNWNKHVLDHISCISCNHEKSTVNKSESDHRQTHRGIAWVVKGHSAYFHLWLDTADPPSPWRRRTPSPSQSNKCSLSPRQKLERLAHLWLQKIMQTLISKLSFEVTVKKDKWFSRLMSHFIPDTTTGRC